MFGLKLTGYDGALAVLGVAALVAMAVPILTVAALISFIGIPIAFLLMALPAIAFVLIPARLLQRALKLPGRWPTVMSIAAVLVFLAGAAAYFNGKLDARVDELTSGDMDSIQDPVFTTFAVANENARTRDMKYSACDDICIRLLLNGQAHRVVAFDFPEFTETLPAKAMGRGVWLEKRSSCPETNLPSGRVSNAVKDAEGAAGAAEQLRLKIASGTCLIEGLVALTEADALVAVGRIHRGNSPFGGGLSPGADTLNADRIAVFQRVDSNLRERYRRTMALWYRHPWILAPSIVGGNGLEMGPAFFRISALRNIDAQYYDRLDLAAFLQEKLGLKLALSAAPAIDSLQIITSALDRPGAVDRASLKVMEDFFESLRDRKPATAQYKALALRILDDPRIPAPRATYALAFAVKNDGPAANAGLADILFRKLAATPASQKEDDPSYLAYLAKYIASAIVLLPDGAIRAHRADLESLAHDEQKRVQTYQALERLSVIGAEAVPTFMFLIKDAERLHDADPSTSDGKAWQHPYIAGLTGLCKTGPEASAAIPELAALFAGGSLSGSFRQLKLTTLLLIGAPEDTALRAIGGLGPDFDQKGFDSVVRRVRSGKPDCNW